MKHGIFKVYEYEDESYLNKIERLAALLNNPRLNRDTIELINQKIQSYLINSEKMELVGFGE